jgi:hypothetical protein
MHLHFPAITWCHTPPVATPIAPTWVVRQRLSSFNAISPPCLIKRMSTYFWAFPNNDERPVTIADHNTF